MVRSNRRSRKKTRLVDLSDVETFVAFPEGEFELKVKEIEEGEGEAGDYWKWVFEDASGSTEGTVTHVTSFAKQALFNLKSLLVSLGVDIPDSEFDLEEMKEEFIGMTMMGTTAQEDVDTDNGRRTYTRIVDHWPVDEDNAKPGKSDKKKPAASKRSKKEDVTEEDVNDMSQDELDELIETHELDIDLGDFKTVSKMRAAVIDALKEAGVIEGEEEEEESEEKPARSRRSSKKEEEEDDRPSRSRSSSRSRSKEDEGEEEDERPSRRRRR